MFWGLNLKANRKYTQRATKAFHISQAALDSESTSGGPNQVYITFEEQKFLICTLRKDVCEQVMLDFNFAEGDEISFVAKGDGSVALTGYLVENDDMDFLNGDEEESEEEDNVQVSEKDLRDALNMKKKKKAQVNQDEDEEEDDDDDDDDENEDDEEFQDGEHDEEAEGEDDEDDAGDDDDDDAGDDDEEEGASSEDDEVQQPKLKKAKLDKSQQKQNGEAKQPEAAMSKKQKKKEKQKQLQEQKGKQSKPAGGERTIAGGVKIEDLRVGNGPEAKVGKRAQVYYEGRLKSNSKVFDSTKQGAGFKFSVGRGEVIKGWDVGVVGMKVGGKRRITCPPHMAYGARGSPPNIPPNSTLIFDVELKAIN